MSEVLSPRKYLNELRCQSLILCVISIMVYPENEGRFTRDFQRYWRLLTDSLSVGLILKILGERRLEVCIKGIHL